MATVEYYRSSLLGEWNDYVQGSAHGTFFHLAEWEQVLSRAFGHRCRYLCAREGGRIRGVLPLAEVRSWLFGHSLISTPFCVYGGAIADSEDIAAQLEGAAIELGRKLGVGYVELRNRDRVSAAWPEKQLYVTFRKSIALDDEANLLAIPRKQRAMVRKGIGNELISVFDDGVDRFFSIYAQSVRDLGTPVFPKRYFETLIEVFGERCSVLIVEHKGTPISAVLSFYFRDEVLPYYGGGTPLARDLKGYDFMYWELLRAAAGAGCRVFDYGRSKEGTGSYSFKKNWGFTPEPLHYQYHLVRARAVPNVSPANPKYRMFISAWKRLPLPVANSVGPWLSRNLG
jgi:FemAB-related protein (PEP-CTERM system-associated)